jgi:hypothetical protein
MAPSGLQMARVFPSGEKAGKYPDSGAARFSRRVAMSHSRTVSPSVAKVLPSTEKATL